MNICIFGDSITEGYYDDEKGGWVSRLQEKLSKDNIYNFGISGDTTEDLLERFDTDITGKNPDMIIFAIGINDSAFNQKEKHNRVGIDKFKENVRSLVKKSANFTKSIVFVGLVAVEENRVDPMPWNLDWSYLNNEVEKYDNAIKEICNTENLKFIDVNAEMKKMDYGRLLSDGIHPNSEGHKWMAEVIIEKANL